MATPTQQRLKDAIRAALDSGTWERVPEASGYTIRYSERELATPGWARRDWNSPTYDRHVFLTVVGGHKWTLLLRVARAPWVGAHDSTITFKRAFDVISHPGEVLK